MNTEVEITEGRIAEEPEEVTQAGQTGQNRFFRWIAAGFPPGAHILTEILCSAVLLALLISGSMRFYQRMDNWKAISREMQAEYDRLVEEAGGGVIDIYWDPYVRMWKGEIRKKRVVTIHDLIDYKKNDQDDNEGLEKTLLSADHIVAISEYVKEDCINTFPINSDKMSVIPKLRTLSLTNQL